MRAGCSRTRNRTGGTAEQRRGGQIMRGTLRLLLGLAIVALAVAATVFFADRPGTVHLVWLGRAIDTSVETVTMRNAPADTAQV